MQTLLNLHPKGEYGVLRAPNWPYLREGLKRNMNTVLRYYRRNPTAVKAQHFLVRLLQSIAVPQSLSPERYYANVDARALNISMALKMTSSIFRGEVHKGVFYGPDSSEVLIATDESFDPVAATKNWQNLSPVTVLRHPRSDLSLDLPDGQDTGSESGLAVITINVSLLAIQYRAFRQDQIRVTEGTDDAQLTAMQFIRMYVLPNMLPSHLDIALFNRIANMQQGFPLGESYGRHPFLLIDYAERVEITQENVLTSLKLKSQDFVGTLKTIPAVYKDDMFGVFTPPDIAPTRQVVWALVLAQLPVAMFLYRASEKFTHAKDRVELNLMQRAIMAYRSDSMLKQALPYEIYYDVETDINTLAKRL